MSLNQAGHDAVMRSPPEAESRGDWTLSGIGRPEEWEDL